MNNNIEEKLQKALLASKERLEKLENQYKNSIIEQYKDCLVKDIEIENVNIDILEDKIKMIRQDKIKNIKEKIDEYEKYKKNKNFEDGGNYISIIDNDIISLLWLLQNEISTIIKCSLINCGVNKNEAEEYIKCNNKIFNDIVKKYGFNLNGKKE